MLIFVERWCDNQIAFQHNLRSCPRSILLALEGAASVAGFFVEETMRAFVWALRLLIVVILSSVVAVAISVAVVWYLEEPSLSHWKWVIDSLIP